MLELTNIYKSYNGSEEVLKNINLSFNESGLVTILGPSGCGKSTLLNLIGMIDKPTSGEIIYKNKSLTKSSKRVIDSYHSNEVGFIYQNYNLIEYLSVKDNIELIRKSDNLDELLNKLGIEKLKKRKVSKLSGGEKQRVAIARALVNNPSILLCDEPTGALDSKTSIQIMDLLKEISKDKLVIIVTHNEYLATLYSNRIITLKDGCIFSTSNEEINECFKVYKPKKIKVNKSRIINIIKNNLIYKYKRNLLTIAAISIGLISLSLVLGITTGFKSSLEREEKESLSKYPIIVSATSNDLNNELSEIFKSSNNTNKDIVNSVETIHKNKITKNYVYNLNVINNNLDYKINTYYIDNKVITTTNNELKDIDLLSGEYPSNNKEVLLLLDENNRIDNTYLKSINKTKKEYNYNDLIGYTYKINKTKYKIVGIARNKSDSYINTITGIIYKEDNFKKYIPETISLFPKSYQDKQSILNHLNKTSAIHYSDYSSSIKSISVTLMNSISIVLICFSILSLLVSTILIGILSYINVIERIKHIGLLKSFGLKNITIKNIFYLENIIISFLSATLSISIILSIIGTIIPVNKMNKLEIVDCLKYEE